MYDKPISYLYKLFSLVYTYYNLVNYIEILFKINRLIEIKKF